MTAQDTKADEARAVVEPSLYVPIRGMYLVEQPDVPQDTFVAYTDYARLAADLDAKEARIRELESQRDEYRTYYNAVRSAHNGYDAEARAVMPALREPESPAEAILELREESEEIGAATERTRAEQAERAERLAADLDAKEAERARANMRADRAAENSLFWQASASAWKERAIQRKRAVADLRTRAEQAERERDTARREIEKRAQMLVITLDRAEAAEARVRELESQLRVGNIPLVDPENVPRAE